MLGMKTAALAAILVLGALILAGTFFLGDPSGADDPTHPTTVDRTGSEAIGEAGPLPEPDADLEHLDAREPERAEVPNAPATSSGSVRLRVKDSMTGQPVLKFWARRSAMMDMAAIDPPRLSDPATGSLLLPGALWLSDEASAPAASATEVLVSAPLYEPLNILLEGPGPRTIERTVEVKRAAGIVGIVRDGSSAALPSARVNLEYLGTRASFSPDTAEAAQMPETYQGATLRRTDEAGRYAFGHLPPGVYRTRASRDGTVHLSDPIFVAAGRWSLGDHWLDEHVRLAVVITDPAGLAAQESRILLLAIDPETAEPLSLNTLLPDDAEKLVTRYTDAEGRATLGPLSAGTYRVFVQSDDGQAPPQEFHVVEGSRSILELDFHLQPEPLRQ